MKTVFAFLVLSLSLSSAFAAKIDLLSLVGKYDVSCSNYQSVGLSDYEAKAGVEIYLSSQEKGSIGVPFAVIEPQVLVWSGNRCTSEVVDLCLSYQKFKRSVQLTENEIIYTEKDCHFFGCRDFYVGYKLTKLASNDLELSRINAKKEVTSSCLLTKRQQ